MILISFYFLIQGDTLKSVDETLQCIINTGYYSLSLDNKTGVGKQQMFLHYMPTSSKNPGGEVMTSEEIKDFVRKLGFVDKEKAGRGAQIKQFLSLNQV